MKLSQLVIVAIFAYPPFVWSGCGTTEAQCTIIQHHQPSFASCQIRICANANEMTEIWQFNDGSKVVVYGSAAHNYIKVNGQDGVKKPSENDEQRCYQAKGTTTVFCAPHVSL